MALLHSSIACSYTLSEVINTVILITFPKLTGASFTVSESPCSMLIMPLHNWPRVNNTLDLWSEDYQATASHNIKLTQKIASIQKEMVIWVDSWLFTFVYKAVFLSPKKDLLLELARQGAA